MATSARLEELQQKFNENPRRYFAPLANELRKLGDLDQAIALCRTHLPQQPQHVSGHIVLGQALFEAGNTPDARSTFELALELDPENLIALRHLGDIARAQGESATAKQWYERVLDADPRNDEIARLIRDIDQGVAAPREETQPEAVPVEAPSPEPSDVAASTEPNVFVSEAPAEPQEPAAVEDLATAWQHEVEALEAASEQQPEPSAFAALPVEEPHLEFAEPQPTHAEPREIEPESQPVAEAEPPAQESWEMEPQPSDEATEFAPSAADEPQAEPASAAAEPNESWAEPDADFVASVPPVETAAAAPPPAFAEIDYSVFEAVADEEHVPLAEPEQSWREEPSPEAAEPLAVVERPAETSEAPPADDWFAAPSTRDEPLAGEAVAESAFDLDAAFQQVLPNNAAAPEIEPIEVSDSAVSESIEAEVNEAYEAEEEEAPPELDAAEFAMPASASGDGVDDAFAQLDRMTSGLEAEASSSGMLLPDEQYAASAPSEEIEAPQHVDALIGRTPDSGVPLVEEQPAAFVTETMAELYLQQGFREEALAVYRQLMSLNPHDEVLAQRVAALEGHEESSPAGLESSAAYPPARLEAHPPAARPDALGQSVRSFLGVFARRRAPMRRRDPVRQQSEIATQPASPLTTLFGAPEGNEDASAAVLAGAFAAPNGDTHPLPGRPTRAASEELRLGDVFGSATPTSGARAASFDEFFSSGNADQSAPSPLDEEGSDMVQFTAWLEGLKKK